MQSSHRECIPVFQSPLPPGLQLPPLPSQLRRSGLRDKYGPVFTVLLGSRRVVVLCGHEAVKEALVDHAEEFSGRGGMPTLDRIFHGYGVILANRERWKQLRQFSVATLRNLGMGKRTLEERIAEEAECLVEEIRKARGSPFDPSRPISHAVANVISSVAFGDRFDYQDQMFLSLLDVIQSLFLELSSPWTQVGDMFPGIMRFLPGPHNRILTHVAVLHNFVSERVQRNQKTLDPGCPRDYIDAFLIKMEEVQSWGGGWGGILGGVSSALWGVPSHRKFLNVFLAVLVPFWNGNEF
uniref:Uncharacterized protein n=1 Tax=Chelydra serpentina TaxID=8475 RepID=A0A8C3TBD6_CHESE